MDSEKPQAEALIPKESEKPSIECKHECKHECKKRKCEFHLDLHDQKKWFKLIRCCFVEFLGDLIFVFIGTLQGLAGAGVLGAAFAHGITIALLIASLGHISGGHFNPAVTLGVALTGCINPINAAAYIVSQLAGGFVGSLLARAVVTAAQWTACGGGFTIPPNADLNWAQGITVEAIMTMLLVQTVLISAVDTDSNLHAPFAIGLSIFVDILAGANISGASMNPARSLGPSIVGLIFPIDGINSFDMHYIYWVGPFLGAAIAATIYKLFLANDQKRQLLK